MNESTKVFTHMAMLLTLCTIESGGFAYSMYLKVKEELSRFCVEHLKAVAWGRRVVFHGQLAHLTPTFVCVQTYAREIVEAPCE